MHYALRIVQFCVYVLFRLCEALSRLLPIEAAFRVGGRGGRLAYYLLRTRRQLAFANLQLAFRREMSDAELHAVNREHFQLLGANLLAGLRASTMPHEKIWERVTAEGIPDD